MKRRDFLKAAAQTAVLGSVLPAVAPAAAIFGHKKNKSDASRQSAPEAARLKVSLNVRDYGATGDGKTKDTLALQMTIERCSVLGGGEIVVPAGDYLSGALALRSNVLLRLAGGATLNGSPDMDDYPFQQVRWEGRWVK